MKFSSFFPRLLPDLKLVFEKSFLSEAAQKRNLKKNNPSAIFGKLSSFKGSKEKKKQN
jgi:hypothetical protein